MLDLGLTEQQELIRRSAHEFLRRECPRQLVRQIEDERRDYSPEMYRKMADLGWLGLLIPEQYGGSGGDWVDAAVFYEETGKALLPGPHWSSTILGGQIVLNLGSERLRHDLLPRLARGEILLALALAEPEFRYSIPSLETKATKRADGYVLNGTKLFVRNGHLANSLIVVARAEAETMLFLVDRDTKGLTVTPLDTMGGERITEVALDYVELPADSLLARVGEGRALTDILDKATVLLSAEMVGGAEAALELATTYSKQRVAFGHPIGSFQALQHKMANVSLEIECARSITYYSAWLISQGQAASAESAMAQSQAAHAYRLATAEGTQVFGGAGVMKETDISLYFRRAKMMQLSVPPADVLDEQMLAGLAV